MENIGDLQDWELLQSSVPVNSSHHLDGADEESGVIRSDYFSMNPDKRFGKSEIIEDARVDGSFNSACPSWIEPCLDEGEVNPNGIQSNRKIRDEFWSDSGSEHSFNQNLEGLDGKKDLEYEDDAQREVGFDSIGKMEGIKINSENSVQSQRDSGFDVSNFMKFTSSQGEDTTIICVSGGRVEQNSEIVIGLDFQKAQDSEGNPYLVPEMDIKPSTNSDNVIEDDETENISVIATKSGAEEKKRLIWWKLPLELFKFCIFRVSPVWTLSIAAAFVGVVMLKRKLYRLKRKSSSLQFDVAINDKKISQFTSHASRLNEAFSVVRRVPIIRASFPAAGVTPWPAVSLR